MTPNESYYQRIRDSKKPEAICRAMVEFFFTEGENNSLDGLIIRSTRPHNSTSN